MTDECRADATDGFWSAPFGGRAKRWLMVVLVASFIVQTSLVYLDPSTLGPLSAEAAWGREIWHENNCQSCHQFYGFGGFLGPDLTNATERLVPGRLARLLRNGSGRMPAFDLSPEQIDAVGAFLEAMHASGRGQAKIDHDGDDPGQANLFRVIRDAIAGANDDRVARGFSLFLTQGCRRCHMPVGTPEAVGGDLLDAHDRLGPDVMDVLENGRPPAMPPPPLSAEQRTEVSAFLAWLSRHQHALRRQSREGAAEPREWWSTVPWWEFSR